MVGEDLSRPREGGILIRKLLGVKASERLSKIAASSDCAFGVVKPHTHVLRSKFLRAV